MSLDRSPSRDPFMSNSLPIRGRPEWSAGVQVVVEQGEETVEVAL